jgi:antirestriction protein ArdC
MNRNLYRDVTDRILGELEKGALPWVKPWSAYAGPQNPHNAATGRPYSGCNVVLLWMAQAAAGYASPRFLTFKQAQELGGNVRKGERGHKVVYVNAFEREEENEGGTETRRIPFLREFTVFNIEQCENLPESATAGQPKAQNTEQRIELAEEFVTATRADVRHGEGQAYYRPNADYVMMPAFEAFKGASHYYATLFHEFGHWTGHESRLNRDLKNRFGSEAYAAEELIAELTSAFLCAEFGFDGDVRHAGYIQTWIELLKKDERAFFTAASAAQKAADHLRGLALSHGEITPLAA